MQNNDAVQLNVDDVEINPQYYIHITITNCINSVYDDMSKFIYGVNLLGSILVANKTITPDEWIQIKKDAQEKHKDADSGLKTFLQFNTVFEELLQRAFDTREDTRAIRT